MLFLVHRTTSNVNGNLRVQPPVDCGKLLYCAVVCVRCSRVFGVILFSGKLNKKKYGG